MLELNNLSLYINEKCLMENLNLTMNAGEVHVLMGKNGIGKSSIASTIMGDDAYEVKGTIKYNGKVLNSLDIYERSKLGIYFVRQMPPSIEGVTNAEMLRCALSEKLGKPVNIFEFNKKLESICEELELDKSFIHKEVNVGASGGERKKIELLHMWLLEPSFIILDEIDSGLDVDALKIVAKSLKKYYEKYKPTMLIITHSNTLIDYFDKPIIHVMGDKKILKTGDKKLAQEILTNGFSDVSDTFVISDGIENE